MQNRCFYGKATDLFYFDATDLMEIEDFCSSLTPQEVLDYYGLDYENLANEQPTDRKWFDIAFKRGRSKSKRIASDRLFKTMQDKNGAASCIEYLKRFGKEWEPDLPGDNASGSFSFNVNVE